jgi:hypothetical protein
MRVVLHIGTERTGTTSVQNWLDYHAAKLLEDGIFYSACLGRPNNRKVSVYGRERDQSEPGFHIYGITGPEAHDAFCRQVERALCDEFAEARAAGCHTFVVSNEHLHSRLTSETNVSRIADLFGRHSSDIRVLLFLRPQVDMLVSFLSVQGRVARVSADVLRTPADDPYVDFYALYQRWDRFFPGCVDIVNYRTSNNVVQDVRRLLGLGSHGYRDLPRANKHVDYRTAALGYHIETPLFLGNTLNKNRFFFQNDLPVEHPIAIKRQDAHDIHQRFHARNQRLEQITDQISAEALRPDLNRYPERGNLDQITQPVSFAPMLTEMVIRFNAELWIEKTRTRIAEAEGAIALGQPRKAQGFLDDASGLLANAAQAGLSNKQGQIAQLARTIEQLGAKLS